MDRWSIGVLLVLIAIGGVVLYFSPEQLIRVQSATSTAQTSVAPADIIPGTPSTMYKDDALNFMIARPVSTAIQTTGFEGYLIVTQTPVVGFALPHSLFTGTNLGEAGIYIGATSSPSIVATCAKRSADIGEQTVGDMVADGVAWKIFTSTGVGAGNIYDISSYRTVHNDTCFEVVELLHSGNIGNYTPGTVTEFDRQAFSSILDAMTQTFVFAH